MYLVERQLQPTQQLHDQLTGQIDVVLIDILHMWAAREIPIDTAIWSSAGHQTFLTEVRQFVQPCLFYFKFLLWPSSDEERVVI